MMTVKTVKSYGASVEVSADDFELAETALVATDSLPAALRLLRDECGWTLGKAKCVVDLVKIANGQR